LQSWRLIIEIRPRLGVPRAKPARGTIKWVLVPSVTTPCPHFCAFNHCAYKSHLLDPFSPFFIKSFHNENIYSENVEAWASGERLDAKPGIPFMNESNVDLFGVWNSNKNVPGHCLSSSSSVARTGSVPKCVLGFFWDHNFIHSTLMTVCFNGCSLC
jgi:hypothetical protein